MDIRSKIMFRGKCVKTDGWVYGHVFERDGHCYIVTLDAEIEVIPETVSQLIHTTSDKVNHFDGDIYEHIYYPESKVRLYFDKKYLATMGQVYDKEGEYETITIIPSDLEKKMFKINNIWEE